MCNEALPRNRNYDNLLFNCAVIVYRSALTWLSTISFYNNWLATPLASIKKCGKRLVGGWICQIGRTRRKTQDY